LSVFDRRVLLGLLAALWFFDPLVAEAEPIRVALLPIVVHSASGDSDYLSEGLVAMLAARLEQAGGIQVIRMQRNSRSTSDPEAAVEVARGTEAEFVVFGSFTQFGSGASLDVRCGRVAAGPELDQPSTRQVFIQSGDLAEIIPQLDDLAGRIALYVKEGGTTPAPAGGGEARSGQSLVDLERRVERLEQEVLKARDPGEGEPDSGGP
jgi:hypothetical protein